MSSKFNHSRQRRLPVKPIKPRMITSNISKPAIASWSSKDDARQEEIWIKRWERRSDFSK